MNFNYLSILLIIALIPNAWAKKPRPKMPDSNKIESIYFEDNRRLVLNEGTEEEYQLSKSVAAQISTSKLKIKTPEEFTFEYENIKNGLNFCSDEKFIDLPMLSDCSGFLVADNIVMTAGHCVDENYKCKEKVWVFDYLNQTSSYKNQQEIVFKKEQIYNCKEVLTKVIKGEKGAKTDYALILLDRKVTDRKPYSIKRMKWPKVSNDLVMIGHPLGLPKIITDQFYIIKGEGEINSLINADSFSGNSGSPIIEKTSKSVVGMLISGEIDLRYDYFSGCNRPYKCTDGDCGGEWMLNYTNFPIKEIPFRL